MGRCRPGRGVLELGCGPGYGTQLILDRFGAGHVDAIDLHPAMIARARRRLTRRYGQRVRLAEGGATDLHATVGHPVDRYDAVFDFAIIHHIPDWPQALAEVASALVPGGKFYFDEVTALALATPAYRLLFDHPTENRFTAAEFLTELSRHRLVVDQQYLTRRHGRYVLGVATYRP